MSGISMLYLHDMGGRERGIAAFYGVCHFVRQVYKRLCAKPVAGRYGYTVVVVPTTEATSGICASSGISNSLAKSTAAPLPKI